MKQEISGLSDSEFFHEYSLFETEDSRIHEANCLIAIAKKYQENI